MKERTEMFQKKGAKDLGRKCKANVSPSGNTATGGQSGDMKNRAPRGLKRGTFSKTWEQRERTGGGKYRDI